jgi:hypothetical protein
VVGGRVEGRRSPKKENLGQEWGRKRKTKKAHKKKK